MSPVSHTSSGVLLVHQSPFTHMITLSLYITTSEEMIPLHLLEQGHNPAVHRGQALPALLHHQLHPDAGQSAVRGGGSDLEGDRPEHSHEPAAAPHLHIGRVQAGGV